MNTSPAGYALIKSFENCALVAYPDPLSPLAIAMHAAGLVWAGKVPAQFAGLSANPWTNGWGATGPGIELGTIWTQSQADQRLVADVAYREDLVRQAVKVALTQGQFDALVSIVFNVGPGGPQKDGIIRLKSGQPSTLLRKLNAGDYAGAGQAFLSWVSPGSAVEKGLRRRREAELQLWSAA